MHWYADKDLARSTLEYRVSKLYVAVVLLEVQRLLRSVSSLVCT